MQTCGLFRDEASRRSGSYDTLNRLTEKQADPSHPSLIYSHAPDKITYGYDAAGNRTDATVEKGSTVLYVEDTPIDERGRRQFKNTPYGKLTYGYYANSQLKSITSSNTDGVRLGYRYDDANRLAFVDDTSGLSTLSAQPSTTSYSYNANGSLETVTAANGIKHAYSYDSLNRLRTLNVAKDATSLHSYEYKLRASGHRRQVIEGAKTTTYTYDDLYRLTSETVAGVADPGRNGVIGYTLDKVGNREARTSSIAPVASTTNTFNSRDWLSGDTYDANGNTRTSPLTAYGLPLVTPDVYDFENHLIIRHKPDGSTVNLSYDADGLLRQKTVLNAASLLVSATGYLQDSMNPTGYAQIMEERINTTAGTTVKTYAYGSDLISQITTLNSQPSTLRYFTYDGLGSVRELTNESGTITDAYDYDAFGNLVYRVGTTDNAYLYRGERYESDIGQYYLRARFYNQNTGRFWNQDTYEGIASDPASLHKYLYANADPVAMFDPSGHEATLAGLNVAQAVQFVLVAAIATVAIQRFSGALQGEAVGVLGEALAGAAAAAARNWLIANYESVREQLKKAALLASGLLPEELFPKIVPVSKTITPEIAQNVENYQGGKPQRLERVGITQRNLNRRNALRGKGSAGSGRSWDEYPFASSKEGGFGASVVSVPQRENWMQGGIVAAAYWMEAIQVGDKYWAVVIP